LCALSWLIAKIRLEGLNTWLLTKCGV